MKSDRELDALFAGMREEPWPEERLLAWREKVRVRRDRRRFVWFWLLPAPALAAAVLLFVMMRPQPAIVPPAALAKAPAAPALPLPAAREKPVLRTGRSASRAAGPPKTMLAQAAKRGETQFVRIMTDDPDVVILWAVNGNGEGQ
jgi:hypothetical protein